MKKEALPAGWKLVKFGDVVKKVSDRVDPESSGIDRYVAGEHMETDELRIRTWGEVGDGYLGPAFQMRFLPGQVLYGSRRTYLRKVAVPDFEGICANTTFVLEPSSPELLLEFLPYVMSTESFHEHSIKQSKGSVNPYINFSDLTWYEFALPPIDEQRRICLLLKTLLDWTWKIENALSRAEVLLDSYVNRVACAVGESKYKLGEVATLATESIDPRDYSNGKIFEHWSIPALDSSGRGQEELASSIGSRKTSVTRPTVLISMLNPRIRRIAIVEGGEDVICSTEFAVLQNDPNYLSTEYLGLIVRSEIVWASILRSTRGTTKSRERADAKSLLQVELAVPSVGVQSQILKVSEGIEAVIEELEMSMKHSQLLSRSVLNSIVGGAHVH